MRTPSLVFPTKTTASKRREKRQGNNGLGGAHSRRKVVADLGSDDLPLYKKIKVEITSTLSSGKLEPGQALPTEDQLSAQYGVSVGTVRRAMSELVAERVLIRQQGRGTFLAPLSSERMLNSFWHIVRKDGRREVPIVQTLRFARANADATTARALGIEPGAGIYRMLNLMLMGGHPVLVDDVRISQALFPGLTKAEFVARDTTIYGFYQDRFRVSVVQTVDSVRAVLADDETAKLLGISAGGPLLDIERVAYTFHDQAVEWRRSLLHSEMYEFRDVTGGPNSV
jgi:GntR family transcriptional regulator